MLTVQIYKIKSYFFKENPVIQKIKNCAMMLTLFTVAATPLSSSALPIDWNGVFGVDYTNINNYRMAEGAGSSDAGSIVPEKLSKDTLAFQSMLFRLQPTILINDSASFKAELTHGYGRTQNMGQSKQLTENGANDAPLYLHNSVNTENALAVTKAYMELYSDTATYQVGRHPYHWGLGAMIDSGEDIWDRHFYVRDGITMKMKLGHFAIEPYYSVPYSHDLTGDRSITDYGFALKYDNPEQDVLFGLLYSQKNGDGDVQSDMSPPAAEVTVENSAVRLVDIYFKQVFKQLTVELEIPWIQGDIGTIFDSNVTEWNSTSYILESRWQHTNNFSFGVNAGFIEGHDGKTDTFGATYLSPNYKIGKILLNYNNNLQGNNDSFYDSFATNAQYIKLHSRFLVGNWTLDGAIIYAMASETAEAGKTSYNHSKKQNFTANYDQEKDMGTEFDFEFTYKWNNEVSIGGSVGYLMTGDYYTFNNTGTPNKAANVTAIQINAAIDF